MLMMRNATKRTRIKLVSIELSEFCRVIAEFSSLSMLAALNIDVCTQNATGFGE
jgi:hypothetical protein